MICKINLSFENVDFQIMVVETLHAKNHGRDVACNVSTNNIFSQISQNKSLISAIIDAMYGVFKKNYSESYLIKECTS